MNKSSLNALMLRIFLVFTLILLSTLALFQFVLLKPMYEAYRLNQLKGQSMAVAHSYLNKTMDSTIQDLARQGNTCIRVISTSSDTTYGSDACLLNTMSSSTTMALQKAALENEGHYVSSQLFQVGGSGQPFLGVIDTQVIANGQEVVTAMVYDVISPIAATKQTLVTQIWMIGFLLFSLIVGMMYWIRQKVVKPLIQMNKAAKELGKGKYDDQGIKKNYREVEELNQTLHQASLDIQKADQAKRDLLANVSHDLKTPLTMISGYGEMMQDIPEEKTNENLQVIVDEANRLNHFVNDLLDLSRLEDHQKSVNLSRFDLVQGLSSMIQRYEVYAKQEHRSFQVELPKQCWIQSDETLLVQVIQNFLSNAFHYTKEGDSILLRLQDCRLMVKDSGQGIKKEDQAHIFDRYYKVQQEHRRFSYGTGIGLSIAKENLELLKLKYGVQSEFGHGSTFWIELPEEIEYNRDGGTL